MQNDPNLTRLLETAAQEAWGRQGVQLIYEPSLGAEDFSLYLQQAPGSMFRLGVGFSDRHNYPLHHPQFDGDESAIVTGVVTMAYAAIQYWHQVTPTLLSEPQ